MFGVMRLITIGFVIRSLLIPSTVVHLSVSFPCLLKSISSHQIDGNCALVLVFAISYCIFVSLIFSVFSVFIQISEYDMMTVKYQVARQSHE